MRPGKVKFRLAVVVLCVTLGTTGCGGSGTSGNAVLRGTSAAFPDYLDPALALSFEGLTAMWNTYVPLLTYRHASGRAGTQLIPGLARSLPRVSPDGRTYTLFLRHGLRYSNGELVLASDFRHSVERLLTLNSGGSPFFEDIVGAARFERTKKGAIAGIRTDDHSGRITIRLREANATFAYSLAMLYAAPLPAGTPDEDLSADPPPATGPYEIISSRPGRSWEYRRNPEWAQVDARLMPQLPGGHFDRIKVSVTRNPETQVNQIERGEADWMINSPPSDRIGGLKRRFQGTQLLVTPQIDNFYFWMNTTVAPFDDARVRRAVNYAIDPGALERIYGPLMSPLQQVLPPVMPGHRTIHPYPADLAKAKALVAAADPRERQVTVWTDNYPPNLEAGEYYEGVLQELGFEPTLKVLTPTNYFAVIGNTSTPNLDTGLGNWLLDYPHPNDYFESQLSKGAIQPTNSTNWAQFQDPGIEARLAKLRREPLGHAQEAAYARLDARVMQAAPWAPFGTISFATFVSRAIDLKDLVVSPVFGQDLTSFRPAR